MSMTKNEGTQAAIPHQDTRNLSCRAWFSSPRGKTMKKQSRREKTRTRRFSHGIARAIESLRGLRLSLVPRPDPGECVLPGVRDKTEGLSIAGEPETAWAPMPQAAYQGLGSG